MKKFIYSILIYCFTVGLSHAQIPGTWTVNPADYNYSMQVTSKLNKTCVDLNNANNAVAAFVGGQCRGIAYSDVSAGSDLLALLVIYSNAISGEEVTLQVYNDDDGLVFDGVDKITFNSGDQIGGLSSPFLVTDNHGPTDISLSAYSFPEDIGIGVTIATLSAIDVEEPFTFSLPTGQLENNKYTISGTDLLTNSTYSFNRDPKDTIRIMITDSKNCTYTKDIILEIEDVNDPPTDIIIDTLSIVENNPVDFYISRIKTVDEDLNDSFTYEFVSGSGDDDNSQFYIIEDQLYIATRTNYDVKNTYAFRIRSTDSHGAFIEKSFVLTIIDNPNFSPALASANYVSPNGDGKNDYWNVQNVVIYKDFSLTIFDQFGNVVYEKANNYNNEWDGKLNGRPLPDGNYYYIFKNDKISYKGNLTIVN
ncbi:MAG: gliding motility-associated C-terminal domain-containing protein [Cytophagaceae bacterium]